jgi:hypothetical protein
MGVLGPLLSLPDGAPVTTDPWLDFLKKLRMYPEDVALADRSIAEKPHTPSKRGRKPKEPK